VDSFGGSENATTQNVAFSSQVESLGDSENATKKSPSAAGAKPAAPGDQFIFAQRK
jgi:hypothetical protein